MIAAETDLEVFMDAAAAFLNLPIPEAFRPGVLQNLATLRAHAALVMEFEICDQMDAAPIFRP